MMINVTGQTTTTALRQLAIDLVRDYAADATDLEECSLRGQLEEDEVLKHLAGSDQDAALQSLRGLLDSTWESVRDFLSPPKSCAHCGASIAAAAAIFGTRYPASVNGDEVCHTDWKVGVPLAQQQDCYRLVTVYGEALGARKPAAVAAVPPELARMLDEDAGKAHSADGPVLASLARILARHEEMVRERVAAELDRQAYRAAVSHVDGPHCLEAVTWAHAVRIARGTGEEDH